MIVHLCICILYYCRPQKSTERQLLLRHDRSPHLLAHVADYEFRNYVITMQCHFVYFTPMNIMPVNLRRIKLPFILLVILPIASMLFSTQKRNRFTIHFANSNDGKNVTFGGSTTAPSIHRHHWLPETATFPCSTVGFVIPRTGNGLGNHLFYYAGTMYVAWLTGRRPVVLTSSKRTKLDRAFNLDIMRLGNNKRCRVMSFYHHFIYAYNRRVEDFVTVDTNVSIKLTGSFCSWKYTQPIEEELRRKLRFHRKLTEFAERFIANNVPHGWNATAFVRVGVHVRRGNFLGGWAVGKGFTVAGKQYLTRAMTYFIERYQRVQFFVASNDIGWCRRNINMSLFNHELVNITFSVKHSTEQDLALLASCDHSVMSTGTYSWWASWLANGTTVYYKKFPRQGSWLWRRSRVADYFPPTWIGMS